MFEAALGSTLGQLANALAVATMVRVPWAAPTITALLLPAMRWSADLFLTYWLWQAQRVRSSWGGAFGPGLTQSKSALLAC